MSLQLIKHAQPVDSTWFTHSQAEASATWGGSPEDDRVPRNTRIPGC